MIINESTAICTGKILLVPYKQHHVPTYHEWMQDEVRISSTGGKQVKQPSLRHIIMKEIRLATASEPLSLEEEYSMQQSWRMSSDKLTFISCLPARSRLEERQAVRARQDDAPDRLLGDVNLFLYHSEEEDEKDVIGEVELMIASRAQQGQGFGRASLVAFFEYLSRHEEEIVGTFVGQTERHPAPRIFKHLRVKVNETNERSINLFSSVGFEKVSHVANYFGELELRMQHDLQAFSRHVATEQLEEYREVEYLESM